MDWLYEFATDWPAKLNQPHTKTSKYTLSPHLLFSSSGKLPPHLPTKYSDGYCTSPLLLFYHTTAPCIVLN